MNQGGNFWTLFTPGIWKLLHAVLQSASLGDPATMERKQVEEALRASEGRLHLAQEAVGMGIIDRDFLQGTYTWTDQQWRLLGLAPGLEPPSTAIWLSAIHPDDLPAASALRDATWNDPSGPFDIDYHIIWPDGSVHWLKARARALFGPDNRPVRAVCTMIDVT